MNERKIIDRTLLAGLAKKVGLNASHLEALGESRHWEIVVGIDMLERLVEIQHRFERLVPDSYHNYMGYQEEGTVYELPWEYECSEDADSVLTKEQY